MKIPKFLVPTAVLAFALINVGCDTVANAQRVKEKDVSKKYVLENYGSYATHNQDKRNKLKRFRTPPFISRKESYRYSHRKVSG